MLDVVARLRFFNNLREIAWKRLTNLASATLKASRSIEASTEIMGMTTRSSISVITQQRVGWECAESFLTQ